ncbi:SAM-dependent methyltransferase, partial [Collinsella aerofaciens]
MGKLFVVGIGPGGPDGMTIAARCALEAADIVVGYTKYVELALAAVPDAAHLATPMMHEVERCRLALSRAQSGEAVALVCSGDAGVYGMASPVLELAEDYPDVDVEVIAGATAAQS